MMKIYKESFKADRQIAILSENNAKNGTKVNYYRQIFNQACHIVVIFKSECPDLIKAQDNNNGNTDKSII